LTFYEGIAIEPPLSDLGHDRMALLAPRMGVFQGKQRQQHRQRGGGRHWAPEDWGRDREQAHP
jgi:hypothetical protein